MNQANSSISISERNKDNKPELDIHHRTGSELMSVDTLSGNKVCNQKGDDLGEIKDIMLDTRTGKVGYAVLSFGGFLGMGEKLFAVPWNALVLDTEKKRFVLDVEKDRLKQAPGFDKDQWPNMADKSWARDIHSYYGTKPYWDAPRG
jgi:sporulation protein YlmC with PRC-barrel domain